MKIETILDALEKKLCKLIIVGVHDPKHLKNMRQYHTFRDRIIRMDKDKDEEIEYLVEYGGR